MSDQNPAPTQTPAQAPQPNPAFQQPPTGAPGGPPIPPTIPLTVEEYQRLRGLESQLGELQKAQAAALEAKQAEVIQALAEKGKVQEALEEQRKQWEAKYGETAAKLTQFEQQVFAERKDATLANAFQGIPFAGATPEDRSNTAAMVRRLLQDDFETARDASGSLVVRDKVSGRPAADVIRERLASPQYAIFLAPTTRGGAGGDGTRTTADPTTDAQARASLLEAFGVGRASAGSGLAFRS